MADIQEAIRRLRYIFSSEGADKVVSDQAKVGAAVTASSTTQEKSSLSLEKSFAGMERRYVSTVRQSQDYAKVQDKVNAAVAQNPALQERANVVLANAALQYGQASVGARTFAAATSGVSGQLIALSAGAGPVGVFLAALGPWGIAAAVGLGVLSAKSIESIAAFKKFEEEELTLNSMLKSTGFAAGKTAEDIEKMATEIGNISEVRKAGIELIKFGNIAGDVFDRTMVAADDLSAAGFGSISSAAAALGKALESPQDGLTRLRRAGIIFSDSQIAMVKNMQETGRLAEAQKFILDELAKKVGGAGAARDQGLGGAYEKLGDATERLLVRWGRQITIGLNLTGIIKGIAAEIDKANTRATPEEQLAVAERNLAARGAGPRNMGVNRGSGGVVNRSIEVQKEEVALLRLVVANKAVVEGLVANEAAMRQIDAARERSRELISGTVRELEKETDLLRKNAFERAVDAAMRKSEATPGGEGDEQIRRAVNTKMATQATEQFIDSTSQQTDSLKIEAVAMGMSAAAAARYKIEQELLARETAKGVALSPEQRANIKALAAEYGAATGKVEAFKNAEAARSRLLSIKDAIGQSEIEVSVLGKNVQQTTLLQENWKAYTELRRDAAQKHTAFDDAQYDRLKRENEELARKSQFAANERIKYDIRRGSQTAFLTSEDVQIAEKLKGKYEDVATALNSVEAAGMRMNNAMSQISQSISGGLSTELLAISMHTKTAGEAFKSFSLTVITAIQKMIIELMIVGPLMQSLRGMMGGGGGLLGLLGLGGGGNVGGGIGIDGSAKGNVFDQGRMIHPYALGGIMSDIVTRPTLFPMARGAGLMGEAGPEAIMPLRRGPDGRLGVASQGGGGSFVFAPVYNIDATGSNMSEEQFMTILAKNNKQLAKDIDRSLPDRFASIQRDPRKRG